MWAELTRWNDRYIDWSRHHRMAAAVTAGLAGAIVLAVVHRISGDSCPDALTSGAALGVLIGLGSLASTRYRGPRTTFPQAIRHPGLLALLGVTMFFIMLGLALYVAGRQDMLFFLIPLWWVAQGVVVFFVPSFPNTDLNPRWLGAGLVLLGLAILVPIVLAQVPALYGNVALLILMAVFGLVGCAVGLIAFLRPVRRFDS